MNKFVRVDCPSSLGSGATQPRAVFCRECDDPIPTKRLHAVPSARYCRDCQEKRDVYAEVPEHALAVRSEHDGQQHAIGGDSSAHGVGL